MILLNESGFQVAWLAGMVHAPAPSVTFIVKGTFDLKPGGPVSPAGKQLPLNGDDPAPEEAPVPPRYPSDFAPFKPKADLLVVGHACAPKPATELRVAFEVGTFRKELAAIGDRKRPDSKPEPFTKIPIVWENAQGGKNNPVGRDVPNVVVSPTSTDPAGFGPLCLMWPQRLSKAGTYGKKWLKERWPHFPDDFDWGFFNAAPADQQLPGFLDGDEKVAFTHLHSKHARYESALPGLRVVCFFGARHGSDFRLREVPMNLDTLWADLDAEKLVLVWRGVLDGQAAKDDLVYVAAAPLDAPRSNKVEVQRRIEAMAAADVPPPEPEAPPRLAPAKEPPPPKPDLDAESFAGAVLTDADFRKADLAGRDFTGAVLTGADFSDADLREANFTKADLDGAKFNRADLRGAIFEKAVASRARFRSAKLSGVRAARAILDGAHFSGTDMREADFSGADLSDSHLHEANLAGAKLIGAKLERAWGERMIAKGADFTEVGAADAVFAAADFQKLKAGGSVWERAHLYRSDFTGADLAKAEFEGAYLAEARLSKSDLTEARLPKTNLRGAEIFHANLLHAVLAEADLTNADLRQSNCFEADFHKTVTEGARLDGANVDRTWLTMA
ncbi:MAG: DUF2169 domain-containing protein [Planctomycetes bacterium]|nr:DUF2169 domain-containing protein [Planctomycetota bacterium]